MISYKNLVYCPQIIPHTRFKYNLFVRYLSYLKNLIFDSKVFIDYLILYIQVDNSIKQT